MTQSCSSGSVLLVQGFHTCSPSLSHSRPQPVTVPSAPPCDGTEVGWVAAARPGLLEQAAMLSLAGCGTGYTDTVVKGSLEQQKFLIFYIR